MASVAENRHCAAEKGSLHSTKNPPLPGFCETSSLQRLNELPGSIPHAALCESSCDVGELHAIKEPPPELHTIREPPPVPVAFESTREESSVELGRLPSITEQPPAAVVFRESSSSHSIEEPESPSFRETSSVQRLNELPVSMSPAVLCDSSCDVECELHTITEPPPELHATKEPPPVPAAFCENGREEISDEMGPMHSITEIREEYPDPISPVVRETGSLQGSLHSIKEPPPVPIAFSNSDKMDAGVIVRAITLELRTHMDRIDRKLEDLRLVAGRAATKKRPSRSKLRALAHAIAEQPGNQNFRSEDVYYRSEGIESSVATGGIHHYASLNHNVIHRQSTDMTMGNGNSDAPTRSDALGKSEPVAYGGSGFAKVRARTQAIEDIVSKYINARGRYARELWLFMESPFSSPMARMYSLAFLSLVICSVFFSVWQTVAGYPISHPDIAQAIFETFFALELAIRCYVCPDRREFAKDPFNYLDLLSACPLLCRILLPIIVSDYHSLGKELPWITVFLPAIRLLKLTRRFEKLRLLVNAFLLAIEALPVLLYTLSVIALLFAGFVERVEPVDNIENLPKALWFVLVTMTTVGYGDTVPTTTAGHFVTTVLILFSVLYMAIPIGIVGNAFSTVWGARDKLLLMQRMRAEFLQHGFTEKALQDIISAFDENGDGELGPDEFQKMLQFMHINVSDERMFLLMESLDDDGSGTINVDELITGLFPRFTDQLFLPATTTEASFQPRPSTRSVVSRRGSKMWMPMASKNSKVGSVCSSAPRKVEISPTPSTNMDTARGSSPK